MHRLRAAVLGGVLLSAVAWCAARGAEDTALKVSPSPMKRLAEGVRYEGRAWDRPPARLRGLQPAVTAGAVRYYSNPPAAADGLLAWDAKKGTITHYGMFDVALAAGWYKRQGNEYLSNMTRGVFRSGQRLWMGSNGVGVLVLDPAAQTWSRFDMKPAPVPGHHMTVHYADDDFAFVSYGYHRKIPGAKPSLQVCSVREGAWFQLDAIPSRDALKLGHSGPMSSIGFDYRPLATQPYVPLRAGATFLTSPTSVSRRDDGSYLLTYRHSEESSTELLLRRPLLDQAFRDQAKR